MVMLEAFLRFATGQPSMLWFEVIHDTIPIFIFLSISLERSLSLSPFTAAPPWSSSWCGACGGGVQKKGNGCRCAPVLLWMTSEVTAFCPVTMTRTSQFSCSL
jgi:hypothetical protein